MKVISALLILLTCLPVFGGDAGEDDLREVRVRILADEEVRAAPGWQSRISSLMNAVSGEYERLFGIRFVIGGFGGWTSDDSFRSLDLLLDTLDATVAKEGCDAILALTAQKALEPGMLGYSLFKEGIILSIFAEDTNGLDQILMHEWGHMFGAAHIADPESIMSYLLQGREFDALNTRAIRLNKARTFNGIDYPTPKDARRPAMEIYREICDFNLKVPARGRPPAAAPKAAGVQVRHELQAVLDESGRKDMSSLDDAYFLIAQIHLEEKEYDQSLDACRAALKLNPKNLETRNLVGIIARRQGRIEEAIETYAEILREKPRSPRFLYNMGIACAKKGDVEKAMGLYRRAVELKPNFAEAWNNIGELGLRSGRLEDAEAAFLKALSLNDSFALAHSNLAEVYVRKKEYDKSLAEVALALRLDAGIPGPHNVRGNVLYQQGKTAEAVAEYVKAITIDPGYEKAYYNLGICRFKEGDIVEAMANFGKAVELAPRFAAAHAGLGYCLLNIRKIDEGIAEIRLSQELGLISAMTHLNLSYAFLLKDEAGAVIEEAHKALQIDPALAKAHHNLGIAYTRSGMVQEADQAFRKAFELDPNDRDSCANLAGLLTALDKRQEALGFYLKAVAIDPNDGVLHNNIAVLYFKEGSYGKAWEHVRKALALGTSIHPGFLDELKKKR